MLTIIWTQAADGRLRATWRAVDDSTGDLFEHCNRVLDMADAIVLSHRLRELRSESTLTVSSGAARSKVGALAA
jgi:hypothetical protein